MVSPTADPTLLLLDEVSLGVAPMITWTIFERLREVRASSGAAMLVVEQNARVALDFCDYAYVLENGRVVLEGPAAELRESDGIGALYLVGGAGETRPEGWTRKRTRWLA